MENGLNEQLQKKEINQNRELYNNQFEEKNSEFSDSMLEKQWMTHNVQDEQEVCNSEEIVNSLNLEAVQNSTVSFFEEEKKESQARDEQEQNQTHTQVLFDKQAKLPSVSPILHNMIMKNQIDTFSKEYNEYKKQYISWREVQNKLGNDTVFSARIESFRSGLDEFKAEMEKDSKDSENFPKLIAKFDNYYMLVQKLKNVSGSTEGDNSGTEALAEASEQLSEAHTEFMESLSGYLESHAGMRLSSDGRRRKSLVTRLSGFLGANSDVIAEFKEGHKLIRAYSGEEYSDKDLIVSRELTEELEAEGGLSFWENNIEKNPLMAVNGNPMQVFFTLFRLCCQQGDIEKSGTNDIAQSIYAQKAQKDLVNRIKTAKTSELAEYVKLIFNCETGLYAKLLNCETETDKEIVCGHISGMNKMMELFRDTEFGKLARLVREEKKAKSEPLKKLDDEAQKALETVAPEKEKALFNAKTSGTAIPGYLKEISENLGKFWDDTNTKTPLFMSMQTAVENFMNQNHYAIGDPKQYKELRENAIAKIDEYLNNRKGKRHKEYGNTRKEIANAIKQQLELIPDQVTANSERYSEEADRIKRLDAEREKDRVNAKAEKLRQERELEEKQKQAREAEEQKKAETKTKEQELLKKRQQAQILAEKEARERENNKKLEEEARKELEKKAREQRFENNKEICKLLIKLGPEHAKETNENVLKDRDAEQKKNDWVIAEYQNEALTVLMEKMSLEDVNLQTEKDGLNQVMRILMKLNRNAYINLQKLDNLSQSDDYEGVTAGLPELQKEFRKKLIEGADVKKKLLTAETNEEEKNENRTEKSEQSEQTIQHQDEFVTTLKGAAEEIGKLSRSEMALRRKEKIRQVLPEVKDIPDFFEDKEIQEAILKIDSGQEKIFEGIMLLYKRQTEANKETIKQIVTERLSGFSHDDTCRAIMRTLKKEIILGNHGIVKSVSKAYCSNLMVCNPQIAQRENVFKDAFKKSKLDSQYRDAAINFLSSDQSFAELKGDFNSQVEWTVNYLSELQNTIKANNTAAEKLCSGILMSPNKWREVEKYRKEHIFAKDFEVSFEQFFKELSESKDVKDAQKTENENDRKLIGYEEYQAARASDSVGNRKAEEKTDNSYFRQLCENSIKKFSESVKAFGGKEDTVIQAFSRLLTKKDSRLKQSLPFMKDIEGTDQLDRLTHIQYVQLQNLISTNLVMHIKKWSGIDGDLADRLREEVIEDILDGQLKSDVELQERINTLTEEIRKQESKNTQVADYRLDSLLGAEKPERKKIEYLYMKSHAEVGLLRNHIYYPTERIERCDFADRVWEIAREKGKEEHLHLFIRKVYEKYAKTLSAVKNKSGKTQNALTDPKLKLDQNDENIGYYADTKAKDGMREAFAAVVSELEKDKKNNKKSENTLDIVTSFFAETMRNETEPNDGGQDSKENREEITKNTKEGMAKAKQCISELLLQGMSGVIFSEGGVGDDVFHEENKDVYYQKMVRMGAILQNRYLKIGAKVRNALSDEQNNLNQVEYRRVMSNISPILCTDYEDFTSLEIKNTDEEEALLNFYKEKGILGENEDVRKVNNTDDLGDAILSRFKGKDKNYISKSKERAKIIQERKNLVKYYDNGKFRLIADRLCKDPEIMEHLFMEDSDTLMAYLDGIYTKIGPILTMLEKTHCDYISNDFILQNYQDIMKGKTEDKKEWENKIEKYLADYMEYKPNSSGKSIKNRLDEIEKGGIFTDNKKNSMMLAKLSNIINGDPKAFSTLFETSTLKSQLKKYDDRYAENKAIFENSAWHALIKSNKVEKSYQIAFRQYLETFICTMDNETFRNRLDSLYSQFTNLYNSVAAVTVNKDAFDGRLKAMKSIEAKKEKGRNAAGNEIATTQKLQYERWYLGSPVLAKFGREEKIGQAEGDKKLDKIKSKFKGQDIPDIVLDILSERQLSNSALDDDELKKHCDILQDVYSQIKSSDNEIVKTKAEKCLIFFYLNADLSKDSRAVADSLKTATDAFLKRSDVLWEVRQKADIHKELISEYENYADALEMGLFTMTDADFYIYSANQKRYFENANMIYRIIDDKLQNSEISKRFTSDKGLSDIKAGLREYYREDMVIGAEAEMLKEDIDTLLSQYENLQYLADSTNLLGRTAYDDLSSREKSLSNSTRKDMETIIADCRDEDLISDFNMLTLEERRLFAMALAMPEAVSYGEQLGTARYLGNKLNDSVMTELYADQIKDYIGGGSFDPIIDYGRVNARLVKPDGTMSKTFFKRAMSFALLVRKKKEEAVEKDWDVYGDSEKIIDKALLYKGNDANRVNELEKIQSWKTGQRGGVMETFKEFLRKNASADEKVTNSFVYDIRQAKEKSFRELKDGTQQVLMKRIEDFSQDGLSMQIFVLALQNRSAMDYSTTAGLSTLTSAKESVPFANEELRAGLIDNLVAGTDAELQKKLEKVVGTDAVQKAAASLLSFQLRDDVDLNGREINQSDFERFSLERNTMIDWSLVRNAIDFVDEVNEERNRLKAVKNAPNLINASGNQKAIDEYNLLTQKESSNHIELKSFDDFKAFIEKNALADIRRENEKENKEKREKIAPLLAGYYNLNDNEKILFIKALGSRDILDVSRRNLYTGFFGQAERDYVNPVERDELVNEYIDKTLGEKTNMELNEEDYFKAACSVLSTQVDDTRDFNSEKDASQLLAGKKFYEIFETQTRRDTAVDWKLFARALQFVKRTSNEREIMLTDEELYRSQGDVMKHGEFRFEGSYLRKNLHNTGSRVNRFLGRRAAKLVMENVPYLSTATTILMGLMSTKNKNKCSTLRIFKEAEEGDTGETITSASDLLKSFTGENAHLSMATTVLKQAVGIDWGEKDLMSRYEEKEESEGAEKVAEVSDRLNEIAGYVQEYTDEELVQNLANKFEVTGLVLEKSGNILPHFDLATKTLSFVADLASDVQGYRSVSNLRNDKKVEELKELDKKQSEKAAQNQTDSDRMKGVMAEIRNEFLVETVGTEMTKGAITQKAVNKVIGFVTDTANDFIDVIGIDTSAVEKVTGNIDPFFVENFATILREAIAIANFIAQGIREKNMVKKYYSSEGPYAEEVKKLRDNMDNHKESGLSSESLNSLTDSELAEKAGGFEGFTEHSSYICLNVVHSILFAANEQNPQKKSKYVARVILKAMGLKDCIGKQDSETAMRVFNAFMGDEYR